jgi:hypothetical protein
MVGKQACFSEFRRDRSASKYLTLKNKTKSTLYPKNMAKVSYDRKQGVDFA